MSRVYLPTTVADLVGFVSAGQVPAGTERFVAGGGEEEEEYLALMSAADACPEPRRRVVVVAEVDDVDDVDGAVAWRQVVAVHADPVERAAEAGADDELAWFAVQEIGTELAT